MDIMHITEEDIEERNKYCSQDSLPKNRPLLDVCENDFNMFMAHMLGKRPYAWQFKANKNIDFKGSNKIVFCNSRQIGKSYEIASLALYRALFNWGYRARKTPANAGQHTNIGIVSRSADQAKKLIKEIKKLIAVGDRYMAKYKVKGKSIYGDDWFSSKIGDVDDGQNNMNVITFKPNLYGSIIGSAIQCLPPTDAILGNTFTDLYLDEASRISDEVIEEFAYPTLDAMGNMLVVASTPALPTGYFFKRVDPYNQFDNKEFHIYVFTIEALKLDAPEHYQKVISEIKTKIADGKSNEVNRNYYCSFISTEETYFPLDKVREVFTDDYKPVSEYRKGRVILGIDFGGKVKSHTVITVATMPDLLGISQRLMCWRYPVKKDGDLIKDIEDVILPFFNVAEIVIDYCPASYMASQQMKDKGWNIREFQFSKTTKPDFMERFRRKIARRHVISFKDEALMEEFIHYGDDMKPQGEATDDMIDSWMLACVPFLEQRVKFSAIIVNPPEDADDLAEFMMRSQELSEKEEKSYLGFSRAI